jgi:CRP/FNR family transcriptional regulator, cyclic AMP receptor protein
MGAIKLQTEKFSSDSIRKFDPGEVIFREGEDSREMFVVLEGTVEVVKTVGGSGSKTEIRLARIARGEFLGEMSLLESLPRSATARAVDHVKLLAIQPGGFLLKIRRDPTFAFEIMQSLSRRIRLTNEALLAALNNGTATPENVRSIVQGAEYETSNGAAPPSDSKL